MTDFHTGLGKNAANYQPLTPIDFIIRSADVYPHRTAIIYDDLEHNISIKTGQTLIPVVANCPMVCAN